MNDFEQGPIRPPSEANSLLVRVSRNCPWNRCTFCPVYKGRPFSLRSAKDVLADLDAMSHLRHQPPKSVFLQDANPLLTPTDDLIRILEGIRERFDNVERITAYARAHTLVRRSLFDLRRLRSAGLDRLHVGLESGCDDVLKLVDKGCTRAHQIEGGRKAKEAGFELSEYVMPGLGGRKLSASHATQTASALLAITPDFVRLRSTTPIPGTALAQMVESGQFEPLSEIETVGEIRTMLVAAEGLRTRLESDHVMNLLTELAGDLPDAHQRIINHCDSLLSLSPAEQQFILGRRLNLVRSLEHFKRRELRQQLSKAIEAVAPADCTAEEIFTKLRGQRL